MKLVLEERKLALTWFVCFVADIYYPLIVSKLVDFLDDTDRTGWNWTNTLNILQILWILWEIASNREYSTSKLKKHREKEEAKEVRSDH